MQPRGGAPCAPSPCNQELKRVPIHSDTSPVRLLNRIRGVADAMQRRLEREDGFTLVELTIVLLVLGILMTIAVPSYLSFKDRASKTAAKADVAQTMRAVIAYGADNFPGGRERPERRHHRQRLHRHHAAAARDEVRRVDSDRRRRSVRDQPRRLHPLLHRLLPDGCRRTLDRRAARPGQRRRRRHPVHARYLHGQLTPGSGEKP